jgi:choline dehydrogenase-like flavoprotein
VEYRDASGATRGIEAQVLVVACGTIGTPALLLRSRTSLPAELSWTHVGGNLTLSGDNLYVALAPEDGLLPMTYQGREDGGVISFAFWREKKFMLEVVTLFPGQAAAIGLARPGAAEPARWGIANKELMKLWSTRMLFIGTIGITPGDGRVGIGATGEPTLAFTPSPELNAFNRDTHETVKMIVEGNGGELIGSSFEGPLSAVGSGSVHPLGSCRLGDDPATSVVSGRPGDFGEAWGAPGLVITDGSAFSAAVGVNPSLTIAALSEWISESVLAKYFP